MRWLTRIFWRKPDFCIGGWENPYIRRWWIIPRNRFFNIYLHNQLRDDDDRALHDHPWYNISIILKGGYVEHRPIYPALYPTDFRLERRNRSAGKIIFRSPHLAHRLTLHRDNIGDPISSWSIFITGPRQRDWGFWCIDYLKFSSRWVRWEEFTDPKDSGKTGKGCSQ